MKELQPQVVSQIRSTFNIFNQGQAVEELVLNSIDAGSTIIDVLVDPQNFSFEVRDNGCGILLDDLQQVGQRYCMFYYLSHHHHQHPYVSILATSKSTDNITTNGFRGEALASVRIVHFKHSC